MTTLVSPLSASSFWLVGLLLGIRHALEPDHLAAVSTIACSEKRSALGGTLNGTWLGTLWGIGHTLALLTVATILTLVGRQMPQQLATLFELAVALMLILLGARSIARASARHVHVSRADHGAIRIDGRRGGPTTQKVAILRRPLAVGLMHGLAGSGALTALVAGHFSSVWGRLATVCLFGVGSIIGMAALSGLAGWPMARLGRDPNARVWLARITGAVAVGVGVAWGWPLVNQLFA